MNGSVDLSDDEVGMCEDRIGSGREKRNTGGAGGKGIIVYPFEECLAIGTIMLC